MKLPLSTDDATESLTGNEINVGGAVGDAIIGLALASASADTVDQAATINQKHKKDGNHSPDKDLPSASILSKKTKQPHSSFEKIKSGKAFLWSPKT